MNVQWVVCLLHCYNGLMYQLHAYEYFISCRKLIAVIFTGDNAQCVIGKIENDSMIQ